MAAALNRIQNGNVAVSISNQYGMDHYRSASLEAIYLADSRTVELDMRSREHRAQFDPAALRDIAAALSALADEAELRISQYDSELSSARLRSAESNETLVEVLNDQIETIWTKTMFGVLKNGHLATGHEPQEEVDHKQDPNVSWPMINVLKSRIAAIEEAIRESKREG
jgi:hypothetical protein